MWSWKHAADHPFGMQQAWDHLLSHIWFCAHWGSSFSKLRASVVAHPAAGTKGAPTLPTTPVTAKAERTRAPHNEKYLARFGFVTGILLHQDAAWRTYWRMPHPSSPPEPRSMRTPIFLTTQWCANPPTRPHLRAAARHGCASRASGRCSPRYNFTPLALRPKPGRPIDRPASCAHLRCVSARDVVYAHFRRRAPTGRLTRGCPRPTPSPPRGRGRRASRTSLRACASAQARATAQGSAIALARARAPSDRRPGPPGGAPRRSGAARARHAKLREGDSTSKTCRSAHTAKRPCCRPLPGGQAVHGETLHNVPRCPATDRVPTRIELPQPWGGPAAAEHPPRRLCDCM